MKYQYKNNHEKCLRALTQLLNSEKVGELNHLQAMHMNTHIPSRMVTHAIDALGRTTRCRLRYANHKRMACDVNVPPTNTISNFGIWIIRQVGSYVIVGMVDNMVTTVVKNSAKTAHVANMQLHVSRPYKA